MSLNEFWDEYELFYEHEFINSEDFSKDKKSSLRYDNGSYFMPKDFKIYQEKSTPFETINKIDAQNNYITFMRILFNLPYAKVNDFLEFHFDSYNGDKRKFLDNCYRHFKGSKSTQGGVEIKPPQQKLMLLDWCEQKINMTKQNLNIDLKLLEKSFIHLDRIEELKNIQSTKFDLKKLIKILEEININYSLKNYYSVAMLGRSILNHIPPVFGFKTFNEVSNNFGTASFKKNMSHLNISMRSIADNYLHELIRKTESLPNENQIDFTREMDFLLGELIAQLKK